MPCSRLRRLPVSVVVAMMPVASTMYPPNTQSIKWRHICQLLPVCSLCQWPWCQMTSAKWQVPYTPVFQVEMIKLRLLPVCSLCQWPGRQVAVPTWRANHSHNLGSCHLTPTATPHHSGGGRIRENEIQKLTHSSDFSIGTNFDLREMESQEI